MSVKLSTRCVESPVLTKVRDGFDDPTWYDLTATDRDPLKGAWACDDVLQSLFSLIGAEEIVLVAKPRADNSTYKVQLSPGGLFLRLPEEHVLYDPLSVWLKAQIRLGRPHIGVRIVK